MICRNLSCRRCVHVADLADESTLLENLTDDDMYCLALCEEIFKQFPLFDETLRHIELCNSVISHTQRNPPKLC